MSDSVDIDISGMTFQQLHALKKRIEAREKEMRAEEAPALRQKFAEQAAALGLTLEDIVKLGKAKRGRPVTKNGSGEGGS